MRFMNDLDLMEAEHLYDPATTPNRAYVAATVNALRDWANRNSDGWAYWPKPARAAARAMELIDGTTWDDLQRLMAEDVTDAETAAALRPIRAFLTRQGVRHETVLPARQTAVPWSDR